MSDLQTSHPKDPASSATEEPSTLQPLNASPPSPLHPSSADPLNPSSAQPLNGSTSPSYNRPKSQSFSSSPCPLEQTRPKAESVREARKSRILAIKECFANVIDTKFSSMGVDEPQGDLRKGSDASGKLGDFSLPDPPKSEPQNSN